MTTVNSFATASHLWNETRKRKLANNTYLERNPDGSFAIKLHATQIVTFAPDGSVTLNSGGWLTPTTKGRMNDALPPGWVIWQERGTWTLARRSSEGDDGATYPYADGMVIHADGSVTGEGEDPRAALKLRRSLRAFARDYMVAFWDGKVPAPSNGDCWGCLMVATDGTRPMGGASHILSHISKAERYYVPSMLTQAARRFPLSRVAQHVLAVAWNPDAAATGLTLASERSSHMAQIGSEQLEKALYRWLCAEVGQAS